MISTVHTDSSQIPFDANSTNTQVVFDANSSNNNTRVDSNAPVVDVKKPSKKPLTRKMTSFFNKLTPKVHHTNHVKNELPWIARSFNKKECLRIVQDKKNLEKCSCGRFINNHLTFEPSGKISEPTESQGPWDKLDDTIEMPTDAYGKISFISEYETHAKPAKYARIADTSSPSKILELLNEHWNLTPPNIVISITGGAKNYKMSDQQEMPFNRGLMKAVQRTGAWLITAGTNLGVVKSVGKAVRDGQEMSWVGQKAKRLVRCIGITSWGYIEENGSLISPDGKGLYPAKYRVGHVIKKKHPVSLNPDHTHFIMVDNGTAGKYGVELNLRAEIEKLIALPKDQSGYGVPVVLVAVEGGLDTIHSVCQAVSRSIPAVLCEGTGRSADILSYAHKHCKVIKGVRQVNPKYLPALKSMIRNTFFSSSSTASRDFDEVLQEVQSSVQNENMLTVFHIGLDDVSDLDFSILLAVLKADSGSERNKLKLALTWNRIDIARKFLFKEEVQWAAGMLYEFMTMALIDSRIEFVKLFLENGLVMIDYLTLSRLRSLYNNSVDQSSCNFKYFMYRMTGTNLNGPFSLYDVNRLIKNLLGTHQDPLYGGDRSLRASRGITTENIMATMSYQLIGVGMLTGSDSLGYGHILDLLNGSVVFEKPFKELYLWAILTDRHELAEYLWEFDNDPISSGLVGRHLCQSMAKNIQNPVKKEKYKDNVHKFGKIALDVLDECYHTNSKLSELLLQKPYPQWGEKNCLNLAADTKDQEFLSNPCCQSVINKIWKNEITCSTLEVFVTLLCPLLIFDMLFSSKLNWWMKMKTFYTAPITKFCSFAMTYILFLLLYAYFILFQHPDYQTYTWLELLIIFWIGTLMVDEFRQALVPGENETVREKLNAWAASGWNIIDSLTMLVAILAFVITHLPGFNSLAQGLYALNCGVFYLRVIRLFSLSSTLGPKLVMIRKMVKELILFLIILFIFLVAYGVASQALLYPHRTTFYWGIFVDIFYMPYFQIYGELFLDDMTTNGNCMRTNETDHLEETCMEGHPLIPVFLAVYLIMVNVLLLNLLIAIFSYVFEQVQTNSLQVWKFEMYHLVIEFKDRPTLPPPFIILEHIYTFFKWCAFKLSCRKQRKAETVMSEKEVELLEIFEKECAAHYRKKANEAELNEVEGRILRIENKLESACKQIEIMSSKIPQPCDMTGHLDNPSPPGLTQRDTEVSMASSPPIRFEGDGGEITEHSGLTHLELKNKENNQGTEAKISSSSITQPARTSHFDFRGSKSEQEGELQLWAETGDPATEQPSPPDQAEKTSAAEKKKRKPKKRSGRHEAATSEHQQQQQQQQQLIELQPQILVEGGGGISATSQQGGEAHMERSLHKRPSKRHLKMESIEQQIVQLEETTDQRLGRIEHLLQASLKQQSLQQ